MRKGEPSDHGHANFTDHWIRRRTDEPHRARSTLGVVPYLPEEFAALPPADRAFYTGRAISLRAHSVPPPLQRTMWPDAERAFREAIGLSFSDPDAWFFLGKALTAQGKHRDAAEAYAAAFSKDPSGHDVAFAQGQSLLRQNRLDDAERVFSAMTRDHPESAAPFAELARCRVQRGDFSGALELFRKGLGLEPWNASLHESAAMVLSALERHPEALAEVTEAIRLDPESPRIRDSRATLQARAAAAR
jgi:tetratricopeptide (TPR) repeat protein